MGSVMWLVGHKVSHGVIQGVQSWCRSSKEHAQRTELELCREICAAQCFEFFKAKICHEGSFSIALFFEANLECTAHQMKASYMSKVTLSLFDILGLSEQGCR